MNNPTTITYPITSAIGTIGEIRLERIGQQHPSDGDAMIVEFTIMLRSDKHDSLLESLRFGNRVYVLGMPLSWEWGTPADTYRALSGDAIGDTWAQAFAHALQKCEEQLAPLLTLIEARKNMLDHAEE